MPTPASENGLGAKPLYVYSAGFTFDISHWSFDLHSSSLHSWSGLGAVMGDNGIVVDYYFIYYLLHSLPILKLVNLSMPPSPSLDSFFLSLPLSPRLSSPCPSLCLILPYSPLIQPLHPSLPPFFPPSLSQESGMLSHIHILMTPGGCLERNERRKKKKKVGKKCGKK